MVEIITDGACSGNPGPGGWAALIVRGEAVEELGGRVPHTTNNRMELTAAIEALRRVAPPEPVRVVTDSSYVLQGATRWLPGWRRRGWVTREGRPVENRDLWEELDALAAGRVTWEQVRGHAGHPRNERANQIAQAHARGRTPPAPGAVPARPPGVTYLSLVDGVLQRHASWAACEARVRGVSRARFKKCASGDEELAAVRAWGLPDAALIALEPP